MEYPSSQSCYTSTPKLGQEGEGWVLHYCCDTLMRPLVVHTWHKHLEPHLRTSVNTSAHTDVTVCVHGGGGWGGVGEGVENLRLPVTSPRGSQRSASSCPDPGSAQGR